MRTRWARMAGSLALVAVGAAALALACSGLGRAAVEHVRLSRAHGALRIAGSSGERAILTAHSLAPGGKVRGRVEIRNTGSRAAALRLAALHLRNGGGSGATMAGSLRLVVRDLTSRSTGIVYNGPFSGLGRLRVGALAPGEKRIYSFVARLPRSNPDVVDNRLAGAWTKVDFRWKLTRGMAARCATRVHGSRFGNRIVGTIGGDTIRGGRGPDQLFGRAGADCIRGGRGRDFIFGGPGNDTILARDGVADLVSCGPGKDVAIVDRHDATRGCERVRYPRHARQ